MRLLLIFIGLAVLVLIPFAIWGDHVDDFFTQIATVEWLRGYGEWAWLPAILLLMGDLLLPLPATVIMSALGIIYGPLLGGLISALGSFGAGSLGYELCRKLGKPATKRLLGEKGWYKGVKISKKIGGVLVAVSRWTPVLPEVVACMAGMLKMSRTKFYIALGCGTLPLAFTYAWLGYYGADAALLTLLAVALLPLLLWLALYPLFNKYWMLD
ncbi:VTT domain-containing protein [Porifericola rhodea]|uniref:TVP38/TMEM64 family protein n=1 Tax=Porifericola rhodea TaxID=930972 RepID=UPI0026671904|nr:VTT domain-containing protein [Porifericola rhodea]WKN33047.1 VTT domain-containing protein [Porifericola rhodea]